MQPEEGRLSMFGRPTDAEPLDWAWVDGELASAEVYWIVARARGDRPQARPVWGVWRDERIEASIGSPRLRATIELGTTITVHLGGALDVVIIEGEVTGTTTDPAATAAYDENSSHPCLRRSRTPRSPARQRCKCWVCSSGCAASRGRCA